MWSSGSEWAASLPQNARAVCPHRSEATAPIVLGNSTRTHPAGVLGALEAIATTAAATHATASNALMTRRIRRSRSVVLRNGVFTRFQ